jgi:hypothetical protein
MKVRANWIRWNGAEFVPSAEWHELEARETPRQLKVTLPSGSVETLKRFNRAGREQDSWRVPVRVRGVVPFFIDIRK